MLIILVNKDTSSDYGKTNLRLTIGVFFMFSSFLVLFFVFKISLFSNINESGIFDIFKLNSMLQIESIFNNDKITFTITFLVIIISLFLLYNIFIILQQKKDEYIALSAIQKIVSTLCFKKMVIKEHDPEIDVGEFTQNLSKELNMDENYIKKNIIDKVSSYFDEKKDSNVTQFNIYLNGKIKSFWKLKEI